MAWEIVILEDIQFSVGLQRKLEHNLLEHIRVRNGARIFEHRMKK